MGQRKRAFIWITRRWNHSSQGEEQIMFGDIVDGQWDGRMDMLWRNKADRQPIFRESLSGFALIVGYKNLSKRVEELKDCGVTAEQFAIILAECGFVDYTAYHCPDQTTRDILQRKKKLALELVDSINDQLATGNYPHS